MNAPRRASGAAMPLTALFVIAAAALAWAASRVTDWGVMTDELLYAELARGVWAERSPLPTLHGERVDFGAMLYPALISPLYGLLDAPDAYRAALALNGVLVASACIPTYLLARAVLPPRWALTAGVLAVATPWAGLAAFLLSGPAAYAVATWALLAIQRAVAAPSPRRDAVALLAVGAAFLARTQLAALAAVLVVAVALHELGGEGPLRARLVRTVRLHRLLAAALVALAGVAIVAGDRLLGQYSVTARQGALIPRDTPRSALLHLDQLALGLGVATFVLGVAWLLWRVRSPVAPERALAAVGLAAGAVLSVQAGSFALRFGSDVVRDRYVVYLVPLVGIAALAYLRRPPRAWWPPVAVAGVVAGSLFLHRFPEREGLPADSPGSVLNNALRATALPPALVAAAATVAVGVAVALTHRRWPAAVAASAAAFGLATGAYGIGALLAAPGGSGRPKDERPAHDLDWVDRATRGAAAAFVPYPVSPDWAASARTWWNTELWNHALERSLGDWTYTDFPVAPLELDRRTGRLASVPAHLVVALADARLAPAGRIVAARHGLAVVRLASPPRAAWSTRGLDADGWLRESRSASLRVYAPTRGLRTVTVRLRAPATGAAAFRLGGAEGRVAPGDAATVSVVRCVRPPYEDLVLAGSGGGTVPAPPRGPVVEGTRRVTLRVERVTVAPVPSGLPPSEPRGASGTCAA